jgi:hypothetical protein
LAKATKKLVRRHTFGWFLGGGSFALANSPGFSLSEETALIVRIISQRIPFIFTDRVKRMATDKLFRGFSQPPERQNFVSGTLFTPIFYNQKQTYLRRRRKKVSCPRHLLLL